MRAVFWRKGILKLNNFTDKYDDDDCDDQTKKRVEASLKRGAVSLAGHTRGRLGQTAGNNGVAERKMKMEAEKKVQLNFEWKPICKLWYKRCQRQCGDSSGINKRLPWAIAWEQLRETSPKQNCLFTFIQSSIWQTSVVIQRGERELEMEHYSFIQKVRANWQETVTYKECADYTSVSCFALIY